MSEQLATPWSILCVHHYDPALAWLSPGWNWERIQGCNDWDWMTTSQHWWMLDTFHWRMSHRCSNHLPSRFLKGQDHIRMLPYMLEFLFRSTTSCPHSTHTASDHRAASTMLDSVIMVRLSRVLLCTLDTLWANPMDLSLIRPQEMVPGTHVLGLLVFSKLCRLSPALASEQASLWDDGHADWFDSVWGVWSEHWQVDLPFLQPL